MLVAQCADASSTKPWGIYVHVPWCRRRCTYCDFYFEIGRSDALFVASVLGELSKRRQQMPPGPAHSLYFGGGTPSLLPTDEVAKLIAALSDQVGLIPNAEVTLEANPEDLDASHCQALAAAGVNRLSLGVQSFDDDVLRYLGRNHSGQQALEVVQAGCGAFPRVSIDLIAGVPGEGAHRLPCDVQKAKRLGVGHVSAYLLSVEEQTPLSKLIARGRRQDIDDDVQADAFCALQSLLPQNGLLQYEVSSYAKPSERSVHNRSYWSGRPYLGLGPGAHSMWRLNDGQTLRRHNAPNARAWLDNSQSADFAQEVLSAWSGFLEAVAFGLRDLAAGVDVNRLAKRYQLQHFALGIALVQNKLEHLVEEHLLHKLPTDRFALTPFGARFADRAARQILQLPGPS